MTDAELLDLARQVCTPRQVRAYELAARGLSQRAIAYALGVDRSTIRGHLEAADRQITQALRDRENQP